MSTDVTDLVSKVTRPDISHAEMREIYAVWATNYDEDMGKYKRATVTETMASVFKSESDKNVTVLDLAAGTGTVGKLLADNGFTNIDAYDGSKEMLDVAESRNIYKRIFCQFIGLNVSPGISEETYDVVICVGAFYPGHLDETCLLEILRMMKKGGRFYFSRLRYDPDPVAMEIEKLEGKGLCTLSEKRLTLQLNEHGDGYIYTITKTSS